MKNYLFILTILCTFAMNFKQKEEICYELQYNQRVVFSMTP